MEFDKCSICSTGINDNNFGNTIEVDEKVVCNNCYKKHLNIVVEDIEQFRKSKNFSSILKLRQKLLQVSEKMSNWMDNATGTHVESPMEYSNCNLFELQLFLVDYERTLVETLVRYHNDKKKQPLLKDLPELQKRISSYISKDEFLNN